MLVLFWPYFGLSINQTGQHWSVLSKVARRWPQSADVSDFGALGQRSELVGIVGENFRKRVPFRRLHSPCHGIHTLARYHKELCLAEPMRWPSELRTRHGPCTASHPREIVRRDPCCRRPSFPAPMNACGRVNPDVCSNKDWSLLRTNLVATFVRKFLIFSVPKRRPPFERSRTLASSASAPNRLALARGLRYEPARGESDRHQPSSVDPLAEFTQHRLLLGENRPTLDELGAEPNSAHFRVEI